MTATLTWRREAYDIYFAADTATAEIVNALGYIQPLRKTDVDAIQGLLDAGYLAEAIESRKARGR